MGRNHINTNILSRAIHRKAVGLFALGLTAWMLTPQTASAIETYIGRRDFSKPQGSKWTTSINIDRYGNRNPIQITPLIPAGKGISVSATPNPINNPGKSSTLSFSIDANAPTGTTNVTIKTVAGNEVNQQMVEINVTKAKTGTGGSSGSGGVTASGGSTGTGGVSASGGSTGTGGVTASGGSTGTGGITASGGATGTGGMMGSGGAPVVSTFSVKAPSLASIEQSKSGPVAVTVDRTNFTGSVGFSVTGLPIGVTAAFSPTSVSGTATASTLTLTVAGGVNAGNYDLTVRGTSGSVVQTAPVRLTVTPQPASFTMTAPAAASIRQGAGSSLDVTVSRINMSGDISVKLNGLPANVTGNCSVATNPNSSSNCSLTATSNATVTSTPVAVQVEATGGGMTRTASTNLSVMAPVVAPPTKPGLRAFPEAEGFGAVTSGGRGGVVCKVTNLNNSGAGSFQNCMDIQGPAYIVFTVSGVIDTSLECRYGNKTISGQTSPGGITTRGLIFDDVYEKNPDCYNIILRHLRSRPAPGEKSATGRINDDAMRNDGVSYMMVDHVSLSSSGDELLQLSRTNHITVQNTLLGVPHSGHYWSGLLMNYSTDGVSQHTLPGPMPSHTHDFDKISLHHNYWVGVEARLPEITCEENGDDRIGNSNCSGKTMNLEVSNIMILDPSDPIWYNRCTATNGGNECSSSSPSFFLNLNFVGNNMRDRNNNEFINGDMINDSRNHVFYEDNFFGSSSLLPDLFTFGKSSMAQPHNHAAITYTPGDEIPAYMNENVGAFPRDAMDQRLVGYLNQDVKNIPTARAMQDLRIDTFKLTQPACASPLSSTSDTDNDGMPDAWERANGLQVGVQDHNGTDLSDDGYTNIEMFLNELANKVVTDGTNAICQYL